MQAILYGCLRYDTIGCLSDGQSLLATISIYLSYTYARFNPHQSKRGKSEKMPSGRYKILIALESLQGVSLPNRFTWKETDYQIWSPD